MAAGREEFRSLASVLRLSKAHLDEVDIALQYVL